MKKLLSVLLVLLFFSFFVVLVRAKECNEGDPTLQQICLDLNELNKALAMSQAATQPLESELNKLESQIKRIQLAINVANQKIKSLEEDIFNREVELAYQQEVLAVRVRSLYKKSRQYSPLLIFLASSSANDLFRELSYRQTATQEDKKVIISVSQDLITLKNDKEKLEKSKISLDSSQKSLDQQADFFRTEVAKAKTYQAQVSSKIAELTARQQEIINARSGSFIASIGDIELADDYNASIKGFRESAPAGYFGVFSFGAFTHRKGMSQYGARGRAEGGQNYKQILNAYYGKEPVNKDTGGDILVDGFGAMNFEDKYLMGIAEMPSSWNMEALKAQAVAARTYAYRYKTQGSSICTTERCQVFNSGKAANPPEAWRQAVQSTRGEVLEDVVTFYASTHGGYASPIGWDTTDGSGGSNFIDKTYDKLGGSPWLYKAWYTQGYSPSSDKCGRSNAWLSPQEMADIVNAAIALKTEGIDTSRITPITTSCWGGNPYTMDELRSLVAGKGGISSATSVSVSQGNGTTNSVNINGVNLSGTEFKKAFNLRAPGRLAIPQSGFAFYNIEKK